MRHSSTTLNCELTNPIPLDNPNYAECRLESRMRCPVQPGVPDYLQRLAGGREREPEIIQRELAGRKAAALAWGQIPLAVGDNRLWYGTGLEGGDRIAVYGRLVRLFEGTWVVIFLQPEKLIHRPAFPWPCHAARPSWSCSSV